MTHILAVGYINYSYWAITASSATIQSLAMDFTWFGESPQLWERTRCIINRSQVLIRLYNLILPKPILATKQGHIVEADIGSSVIIQRMVRVKCIYIQFWRSYTRIWIYQSTEYRNIKCLSFAFIFVVTFVELRKSSRVEDTHLGTSVD